MMEDQCCPSSRLDIDELRLKEASRPALKGLVEVDQKSELAPLPIAAVKVSIKMRGKPLARLVLVEPEPFIEPNWLSIEPVLDKIRKRPLKQLCCQKRILMENPRIVANILSHLRARAGRNWGLDESNRFRQPDHLTAFLRREEFFDEKDRLSSQLDGLHFDGSQTEKAFDASLNRQQCPSNCSHDSCDSIVCLDQDSNLECPVRSGE